MARKDALVVITATRSKEEIVYEVKSSSSITNEEFEYYLGEIIKGICEWKHDICVENIRSYKGFIKERKEKISPVLQRMARKSPAAPRKSSKQSLRR